MGYGSQHPRSLRTRIHPQLSKTDSINSDAFRGPESIFSFEQPSMVTVDSLYLCQLFCRKQYSA